MDDFCLNKDTLAKFWELCCDLSKTNKRYRVSIKEWRETRSLSQNALYHKWLSEIAAQVDVRGVHFDHETWHEYFKKHWCPIKVITLPVGAQRVKSTKKLDTGEMTFYLSQIEEWAIGHHIALTMPDDCEYQKLKNEQVK